MTEDERDLRSGADHVAVKARGRPKMADSERRRGRLTFRVRDALRDSLEAQARASGRSISEQIEYHIEKSLYRDDPHAHCQDESASTHIALSVGMFAKMLENLEHITGRRAFGQDGDPFLHSQLEKIFAAWVEAIRPQILPTPVSAPPCADTQDKGIEALTVPAWPDAARMLGLGRNAIYEAIRRKEIPAIRFGRRIVISKVALEKVLNGQRGVAR